MRDIIVIGYSGHGYVVVDIILSLDLRIKGYIDVGPKDNNPFNLDYLGDEEILLNEKHKLSKLFVAIGDNKVRKSIMERFELTHTFAKLQHKMSMTTSFCEFGEGSMQAAASVLNPMCQIGKGCIINTGAIIEHECVIGDYTHIAPGAVLAGNVSVGSLTFIGANAVVKQNVSIGNNVTIGAGSVIIQDVPDGVTVVGNPGRIIKS